MFEKALAFVVIAALTIVTFFSMGVHVIIGSVVGIASGGLGVLFLKYLNGDFDKKSSQPQ